MPFCKAKRLSLTAHLNHLRHNPLLAVGVTLGLATLAALFDMSVGDEFPVIICYLPAVVVLCWVSNLALGVTLAMTCCSAWLIDDLLGLEGNHVTAAEAWTAVTHAGFFLVITGMLTRLRLAQENERRLSRTDGLTGLLNAKAFREHAENEIVRSGRTGRPVSVAFIDCDNFKTVNDTLGHLEGDRLLEAIAKQMKVSVRGTDIPARMGGDEFAILLPETSETQAEHLITRLKDELGLRMQESGWPVTFSIGVAVYATPPATVDAMIHGADVLMYEVKTGQKDAMVLKLVA